MHHRVTFWRSRFPRAPLLIVAVAVAGPLSACVAPLTAMGSEVRPVTDAQKEKGCEFLTIVTASESNGLSTAEDAQSAMNKIRNSVAEAGGNSMHIISTHTDATATTVTAEALRCDF